MKLLCLLALLSRITTLRIPCDTKYTNTITEGSCSRDIVFNIKRDDGQSETVTFTYFVKATDGIPTLHGQFKVDNCCTAPEKNLLGHHIRDSPTTRTEFRLCIEFGQEK